MIIRLLPEQIAKQWDVIKYGVIQATGVLNIKRMREFCSNLLMNLMANKAQCWITLDTNREIKAVCITRMVLDVGNIPHLLIDIVYGYHPTTLEEKQDFFNHMVKFAENTKCGSVIMLTANPMAMNAALKCGFEETYKVYSLTIGGK